MSVARVQYVTCHRTLTHTTACILYMRSNDISADNKAARVLEIMSLPGGIFIAIHHVVPLMNFECMVI